MGEIGRGLLRVPSTRAPPRPPYGGVLLLNTRARQRARQGQRGRASNRGQPAPARGIDSRGGWAASFGARPLCFIVIFAAVRARKLRRVLVLAVGVGSQNILQNQWLAPEEISSRTAAMSFQVPMRCWRVESLDMSQALTRRRDGAKLGISGNGQKTPRHG